MQHNEPKYESKLKSINNNHHNQLQDAYMINIRDYRERCFAMAFNHQNSVMVSGCSNDIKIWAFEKGKFIEIQKLQGHNSQITAVTFSKKQNFFISGDIDGLIIIWAFDNNNWKIQAKLEEHTTFILSIIFNDTFQQIISYGMCEAIKIWNRERTMKQWVLSQTIDRPESLLCFLSQNNAETEIACSIDSNQVMIWKINEQTKLWRKTQRISGIIGLRISFTEDNEFILQSHSKDGILFIFDKKGDSKLFEINNNKQLQFKDYSLDNWTFPLIYHPGKQLLIQNFKNNLYFLSKQNMGKFHLKKSLTFEQNYSRAALTYDCQYLIVCSDYEMEVIKLVFE